MIVGSPLTRVLSAKGRKASDWLQIALVAMLLQVLTPVLALHSMASASTDIASATTLCSAHSGSADADLIAHAAAHHHAHDATCMACPFCSAVHFAIPASMPAPPLPTVQGYVAHLLDTAAGPRGPPLLRPKARGPPILS